jgi:peptide methionine sulfoxide reductase msrA/msrB
MIAEIVFAAGCFWGVEKYFEHVPGVIKVEAGYTGGNYPDPTYKKLLRYRFSKNPSIVNYTESVEVTFDTSKITAKELIKDFWELHDPTQRNRQGNDIGSNYRSAIFYTTKKQHMIALQTEQKYQKLLSQHGYGKIVTEIRPLQKFYPAEAYHQDYLKRHPFGYCPNHATGIKFKTSKLSMHQDMLLPKKGKEIIVVVTNGFCPFCDAFKKNVGREYHGNISLRYATVGQLGKFSIKTPLYATPTILFIKNGKEVSAHRGYLDRKEFYKALGAFELGKNSKSYNIAFNKGTENRFCRKYDRFKHTPDGVFIDRLSGDILFDTKERFNSGSGWLSFYKAVKGSIIEKEDNSYGMHRIEVIAKKSGIHLGHVFPYGDGKRRFCINANVLEFVPRDKIDKKQ